MNQVKHENKYSLPVNNERDYDETKYGAQNHGNDWTDDDDQWAISFILHC